MGSSEAEKWPKYKVITYFQGWYIAGYRVEGAKFEYRVVFYGYRICFPFDENDAEKLVKLE